MQLALLLLAFATAYVVLAVPLVEPLDEQPAEFLDFPEEQQRADYPRYIEFPDGDGNMHLVDLEEELDTELLQEIARNPADNLYLLFTRRNPTSAQTLVMNNANSITSSNFVASHRTIVIAHGWLSNQDTDINPTIRDAYLQSGETNVIVLDWRRLASSNYVSAVAGVPNIGHGLAQFINFLVSVTGVNLNNCHLIGFSLGAHVAGNAGRALGGQVRRVTGLDPAGPLWHFNSNRLSAASGIYVEAIHTNGGYLYGLGIGSDVGHADFYANGGNYQPGCWTIICDHNRAWRIFAATVTYNHLIGNRCSNSLQITLNTCRGDQLHMGNAIMSKTGSGRFRANTRNSHPF